MLSSPFSLIFLPGLHGSDSLYSELVEALEERSSDSYCITYPVDLSQDYDTLFQWLVEEIDFTLPRVIIAESFSSPLALRLAETFPDSIQGLVIAGGFCSSPLPEALSLLPIRPMTMFTPPTSLIRYFLLDHASEKILIKKVQDSTSALSSKTFSQRIRAILSLKNQQFETGHQVPTLLLQASRDQVIDQKTQRMLESKLPHASVHWLHSPHLIFQQHPVHCAKLINSFLNSLSE